MVVTAAALPSAVDDRVVRRLRRPRPTPARAASSRRGRARCAGAARRRSASRAVDRAACRRSRGRPASGCDRRTPTASPRSRGCRARPSRSAAGCPSRSRTLRIIANVTPPDDDGGMVHSVLPRYSTRSGSRHCGRYAARSSRVMSPPPRSISADHQVRGLAAIEAVGAVLGDALERAREVGVGERRARLPAARRRARSRSTDAGKRWSFSTAAFAVAPPRVVEDVAARERDRGLDQLAPGQAAETLVHGGEPGHRSRHAGGEVADATLVGELAVGTEVHVARRRRGRGLAVVERHRLAGRRRGAPDSRRRRCCRPRAAPPRARSRPRPRRRSRCRRARARRRRPGSPADVRSPPSRRVPRPGSRVDAGSRSGEELGRWRDRAATPGDRRRSPPAGRSRSGDEESSEWGRGMRSSDDRAEERAAAASRA